MRVKIDDAVKRFPKMMSNKFLKATQEVSLDTELKWEFAEIFEDLGFKRLDPNGELEKDFNRLCAHIDFFRKKCMGYWKRYNNLSNKGR